MKLNEYIESGIIESYVLGLASEEERADVEQMCILYPEVLEARNSFEYSLENLAMEQAIAPPAQLKSSILDALTPIGGNVVEMNGRKESPVRRFSWSQLAAAASVALLIGSVAMNMIQLNRNKQLQLQMEASANAQKTELARLETRMKNMKRDMDMMNDPVMVKVVMKGIPAQPKSMATIYWDGKNKDVYVMVNNLPKPASGKQYQLWALVDGKPVDAGTIDMNSSAGLHHMKVIPKAQAFAITLEKEGGSPSPDLSAMYVMGEV